jgi:alpha-mannosidase
MTQTMHVISHTHWDREWYRPYQIFRARLVDVVDAMLGLLEGDPRYRHFHLDGQTIVVEDYLEIRPENAERLKGLIREGRVLLGPWYTQPDEFLVSGEAMVRNLLRGTRMAEQMGGCMPIGYLPDSFGHASQMPQLFAGFGFEAALLFRGVTADQARSAFLWRGADGSALMTIKMPDDDAYSNYLYRLLGTLSDPAPIDVARLAVELRRLAADCEAQAVCDQHLWMDGVDHIFPNPKTPDIIAYAQMLMPDAAIIHSTLPDYARALAEARPALAEQRGELRHANRAWRLQALLANVASSHVAIKQANVQAQVALERVTEPLCAMAALRGLPYPAGLLDQAWKLLLQNHAHDSICGCSVDQVHREMRPRFEQAMQIANLARDRALAHLADRVDTLATGDDQALLVFNPLPTPRDGTLVVDIAMPAPNGQAPAAIQLSDAAGAPVPHQVLAMKDRGRLLQPRFDIPRQDRRRVFTVALDATLPAYGFAAYRVAPAAGPQRPQGSLFVDTATMDNGILRACLEQDGTLTLLHRPTGRMYRGLLALEDRGDGGEGWNWIPPRFDRIYLSPGSAVQVSRLQDGPEWAALRARVLFRVPEGFECAAHEHDAARMRRSERLVELPVEFTLALGAHAQRLDIGIALDNRARNHRLRVLFPTDVPAEICHADSAFDVVERRIRQADSRDWVEPQLGTYPHQSFVCVGDGTGGLAVFTEGTMEYEVIDDPRRPIAITLLRAFGRGAGEPDEYLDSQEPGSHSYRLAVFPYAGTWEHADVPRAAREFLVPVLATVAPPRTGAIRAGESLLAATGTGVDVTAVKQAEGRDGWVVRCVNLSSEQQAVAIGLGVPAREAHRLNLAEARQGALEIGADGQARVTLRPREIATVEIVPATAQ